jgi:hypothetical protein
MNVRTTKLPPERLESVDIDRFGIIAYGDNNLYPQHLKRIVQASGTATLCLNRYAKFVEGFGFGAELAAMPVNDDGVTTDDLLHDVAGDLCEFGGFAIHVNYNVLGEVVSLHHVPFEHARLEMKDDAGYVSHIKVSEYWAGKKNGRGSVSEEDIETFPVFNPDPSVVFAQIEAVGGIENYHGQILWVSMDGRQTYPTPIYDAAVTEISTDEGLSNVKYRSVRSNLLVACMLLMRKGVPYTTESGREEERAMISEDDLRKFQGDENTSKIMLVELEDDEERPEVVEFPAKNISKEFEVTDASVVERVYAQFHQELFYAIRMGKLGFSGSVMQDAYEYYAGEVTTEQRFIERAFQLLLKTWHDVTKRSVPVSILPMRYGNAEEDNV